MSSEPPLRVHLKFTNLLTGDLLYDRDAPIYSGTWRYRSSAMLYVEYCDILAQGSGPDSEPESINLKTVDHLRAIVCRELRDLGGVEVETGAGATPVYINKRIPLSLVRIFKNVSKNDNDSGDSEGTVPAEAAELTDATLRSDLDTLTEYNEVYPNSPATLLLDLSFVIAASNLTARFTDLDNVNSVAARFLDWITPVRGPDGCPVQFTDTLLRARVVLDEIVYNVDSEGPETESGEVDDRITVRHLHALRKRFREAINNPASFRAAPGRPFAKVLWKLGALSNSLFRDVAISEVRKVLVGTRRDVNRQGGYNAIWGSEDEKYVYEFAVLGVQDIEFDKEWHDMVKLFLENWLREGQGGNWLVNWENLAWSAERSDPCVSLVASCVRKIISSMNSSPDLKLETFKFLTDFLTRAKKQLEAVEAEVEVKMKTGSGLLMKSQPLIVANVREVLEELEAELRGASGDGGAAENGGTASGKAEEKGGGGAGQINLWTQNQ